MKRFKLLFLFPFLLITSCVNDDNSSSSSKETSIISSSEVVTSNKEDLSNKTIHLKINDSLIAPIWLDNNSVNALKELVKNELVITLHQYGGFEQTGSLGVNIISHDEEMDVRCGDIVLYNSNQICFYYASNHYSFTRLGRLPLSEIETIDLLDTESVTLTMFLANK